MRIDLNADLGEGFGPWTMGDDAALLEILSSANVACGFHAGDPLIMERTVKAALAKGVEIGAHVGFPDRQGFGRRMMRIETAELAAMVTYQLGALAGIARAAGHRMSHMSFHGALGNMAAADSALAGPLLEAVARFDPELLIISSASRAIEGEAARIGLPVVTTFLADRACDRDGLPVPRSLPNSVLRDEAQVLDRVGRLLREGIVLAYDGTPLPMRADSILLHGDAPGALDLAKALRNLVEAAGCIVTAASQLHK